ncbi:MAG: peptidyl-tRNA hydrolase [Chitinophagaceae bacterium]|nr:peptidyl-tRNA hydrolase [Oligoflexus sp.]
MRRGKEIAQGSHASMGFLADPCREQLCAGSDGTVTITLSEAEKSWLTIGVAKICLQVTSEEQLLQIHQEALAAGLKSHLIRDSGKTEFAGVPTYTACAIGPDMSEKIDAVTGALALY